METTDQERRYLLRDLALIYLTLAHGTDENLDDAEVDTIAEVLGDWEAEASQESVLGAIKGALATYARADARDRVNEAIDNVRRYLSEGKRQHIMDDLVEIAMADGRFLHAESEFIGDLARVWEVSLSTPEDAGRWSVFRVEGPHQQWTPVHDLALVYLSLAYETDRDLSDEEVEAITEKISEWVPDADEDEVIGIVRDVLNSYVQGQDTLFDESVAALRDTVPEHQREPLLNDLHHVAYADGKLLEAEEEMIRTIAQAWDIPWNPDVSYEQYDEDFDEESP